MPRFERDHAFWEAYCTGTGIQVKWGSTGTAGKAIERPFPSAAVAQAKLAEMIAARIAEGFVEITPAQARSRKLGFTRQYECGDDRLDVVLWGDYVQQRTNGRIETTAFPDVDENGFAGAARDAAERIDHLAKASGFVLVSEAPPAVMTNELASNPALEAACLEAPDDEASWSVYRDWLLDRGDLRGVMAANADPAAFFRDNKLALLGHHVEVAYVVDVTAWTYGFPSTMSLSASIEPLPALFALAIATTVRELEIRHVLDLPDVIAVSPRVQLRKHGTRFAVIR